MLVAVYSVVEGQKQEYGLEIHRVIDDLEKKECYTICARPFCHYMYHRRHLLQTP